MDRPVRILGVPTDYGANRRGVDMGPSAIRYAGLADAVERVCGDCLDEGDMSVVRAESTDPDRAPLDDRAKFLAEVEDVSGRLADDVAAACTADALPLVLGGDHSVAIGTMAGAARDADIGVVWFDAHGDFNTPSTTPSGNVHGMPLAAALGRDEFAEMPWAQAAGLAPERVAIVGLRNLDPAEREAIHDSPVTAYSISDIDDRGIVAVVEEALSAASEGAEGLHVSLDLDWLDPDEAPGVGTPERGGVTYREAHAALERVAAMETPTRSLEVVEVNPILDRHNRTAELACELVASALGETVL